MTPEELIEMAKMSGVKGFDMRAFKEEKQEEAFDRCCRLFMMVKKSKRINQWPGSYWLKHCVEDPRRRGTYPGEVDVYTGYVYEGTAILAAIHCGFRWEQRRPFLKIRFNMDGRSLMKALEWLTEALAVEIRARQSQSTPEKAA